MGTRSKTTPKAIARQETIRKAVELRKAGATYARIADTLNVSEQTVAKYIKHAMSTTVRESADDLRTLQIERLNHMLLTVWSKAKDPDDPDHLAYVRQAQSLMNDINALEGIEAPKQVNVQQNIGVLMVDGAKEDYIKSLQQMSGMAPAELTPVTPDNDSDVVDAEILDDDDD